jgi:hypothetical protein
VPYLCEGDAARAVYTLDDAIFVLRRDDCGNAPSGAGHYDNGSWC